MKYRFIYNIFIQCFTTLLLMVAAVGCTDEMPAESNSRLTVLGDSVKVTGSLSMPGMLKVTSRGAMDYTPGEDLILTVFEFDLGEDAASSFLSNIYTAEIITTTAVDNDEEVDFNLTLKLSEKPKVLHFMLTDKPLSAPYGSVASILSSLAVGKNTDEDDMAGSMDDGDDDDWGDILMKPGSRGDGLLMGGDEGSDYPEAYWGCVEFPNGYLATSGGKPILDEDGNMTMRDDIVGKLTSIPLIRNFARISVSVGSSVQNFDLIGFKVVNVPTAGTIGPWNTSKRQVPMLLSEDGKMRQYSQIDYNGVIPGNVGFDNQESEAESWSADDFDNTPKYIYEHPYEKSRRTYLIVYGTYSWTDAETGILKSDNYYYKLDIGVTDENKVFRYYNIIRNIQYNVVITNVESSGCAKIEDVIYHPPFNNISASTETSGMLNISDGQNLLYVNQLRYMITDKDASIDVLYRYIEDITGTKRQNNSVPKPEGLKTGEVIKSFTEPHDTIIDDIEWKKFTIKINNPDIEGKTQSFSIIDKRGLSRTITIRLQNPFRYEPVVTTEDGRVYYATVAKGEDSLYDDDLREPADIGSNQGENFTVYFNLPQDMPDTMFPLVFYLESKAQGIENNKVGNLVVTSGPSLFNPDVTTISYMKKVTYEEYSYKYKNNKLDVGLRNSNHTIRCRFTTILDAELDDAEIRIHNPYFTPDISAVFRRVKN